jgi:hypothetical protein
MIKDMKVNKNANHLQISKKLIKKLINYYLKNYSLHYDPDRESI